MKGLRITDRGRMVLDAAALVVMCAGWALIAFALFPSCQVIL